MKSPDLPETDLVERVARQIKQFVWNRFRMAISEKSSTDLAREIVALCRKEMGGIPEPKRLGEEARHTIAEPSAQVWLRDVGGHSGIDGEWDECWVPCAKGDPGACLFATPPTETPATSGSEPSGAWRDIESAPKDGTRVLGWIVYDGHLDWNPDPFQRASIMLWDDGCTNPGWERAAGWHKDWIGEPSHWMPLPAAPSPSLAAQDTAERPIRPRDAHEHPQTTPGKPAGEET